jgi:AraC-like DNA-binding protein
MQYEYELIPHDYGEYHLFLVELLYRTPHMHRDFELSWILDGETEVSFGPEKLMLKKNDLFIANPYDIHELHSSSPALILSLQVSPAFFMSFFSRIEHLVFQNHRFPPEIAPSAREMLYQIAIRYMKKEPGYELLCASGINQLFYRLFSDLPFCSRTNKELLQSRKKGDLMGKIVDYIDRHSSEKLLLSDIAEKENLNLYYLSHLFKSSFGMPFQEYLSRVRCEKARKQLILTDLSLLDICLSCGFSDPKYFNRDFQRQYGCTPKQYRQQLSSADQQVERAQTLTVQDFLDPEDSLEVLGNNQLSFCD